jgi:hypothetical protein
VGAGEITGFSQRGFPQVNNVAVAWMEMESGLMIEIGLEGPSPLEAKANWPEGVMRGAPDFPAQPEIVISPRLLIRLHRDQKPNEGPLDEVVTLDENGECDFHLEQMDDFQWWMRWYSTKARPLPRELIVRLGPSGAYQEFDPPRMHEDEKHMLPEYRTPPENITQEVDHFIRYFGMKRLLEEMIASTKAASRDEKTNWPDRDSSYLDKLVEDLATTLKNYEGRYPGEPDYYEGESKDGEQ